MELLEGGSRVCLPSADWCEPPPPCFDPCGPDHLNREMARLLMNHECSSRHVHPSE